jgi:hypothetical protein
MWERLRRFNALGSEARGLFLRATVLLPAISISLKARGFLATQGSLLGFRPHPPKSHSERSIDVLSESERARLTVRMVNAAVRHAWHASTCLEKSLALWWLLRRQGIVSELRIGARKSDGKFEAHAWVARNGVALNESREEHSHYATFDAAFPLPGSESS